MRYLVSGSTVSMRRFAPIYPDALGVLLTPASANDPVAALALGLPWAADNSAFSDFNPEAFRQMLAKIRGLRPALFVACPDVVADALATLKRFDEWHEETIAAGHPVAFVGQDGIEDLDIPWDRFSAWFIGGSTAWKLSQASADLAQEAKQRGKFVHVGRVNSEKRIKAAEAMGADSVDGTSASMFCDAHVPRYCSRLRQLANERSLFA